MDKEIKVKLRIKVISFIGMVAVSFLFLETSTRLLIMVTKPPPPKINSVAKSSIGLWSSWNEGNSRERLKDRKYFRVVCMGGSTTYGGGVENEKESYPGVLDDLIRESYGTKFEILNAGIDGATTAALLRILKSDMDILKPGVLLVYTGWNDIMKAGRIGSVNKKAKFQKSINFFKKSSFLRNAPYLILYLLRGNNIKRYHEDLTPVELFRKNSLDANDYKALGDFKDSLSELISFAKEKNIEVVILTLPSFIIVNNKEKELSLAEKMQGWLMIQLTYYSYHAWFKMISEVNNMIINIAKEHNVKYIDTSSINDYTLYRDMCHMTDKGYRKLAELVFSWLQKDHILDKYLAPHQN